MFVGLMKWAPFLASGPLLIGLLSILGLSRPIWPLFSTAFLAGVGTLPFFLLVVQPIIADVFSCFQTLQELHQLSQIVLSGVNPLEQDLMLSNIG